jgi:hypothetical protein
MGNRMDFLIFSRKLICVIFALLASGSSLAGGYPPTDIDLRAAYCLPVVKMIASVFGQPQPNSGAGWSKEDLEFLQTEGDKIMSNLSRIQSYLTAKINVDTNAMLIAMNRSKTDMAALDRCEEKKQCLSYFRMKEESDKCHAACNKETGGARDRVSRCADLSWLPF